jgi:hypothetical protein
MGKHRGKADEAKNPNAAVTGKLDTNDKTFTPDAPGTAPGVTASGYRSDDKTVIFVEKPEGA